MNEINSFNVKARVVAQYLSKKEYYFKNYSESSQ